MTTTTRRLTADDLPQMWVLSQEAFGAFHTPPDPDDYTPPPGRHSWGTFEGDALAAMVVGREFHSWFHGRQVPTNGIASVAVAPEHRGGGLLDGLFAAVLDEGLRERGEVISTLYPTAPGIYRRYGYELISSYDTVEIPTARLSAVPAPQHTTLRRATAADVGAVRRLHATWAAHHNGPLTRTAPSFPDDPEGFIGAFTGVTLAESDDEVVGFARWNRGTGYDQAATIEIIDLVAVSRDATLALWRLFASYSTVTGQVRLKTSGLDSARLVLPFDTWSVVDSKPYMLRVHDVPGAFSGLSVESALSFSVAGDLMGTANGDWALTPDGDVVAGAPGGPTFAPRGLAMFYAGAATCADLRMADLLSGPTDQDTALDRLLDRRQLHIRNYF